MKRLIGGSGLFLFAACIVLGQSTGSVSGTIQDDTGQPVAGGYAVASPVGSSATHLTYTAMTAADGKFSLTGMQPGRYSICVQVPAGPHLDPCRWSSAVQVTVAPGQPVTNQAISVTKGSILQVRIDDPNKVLATSGPGDVLVGVFLPSAVFEPLSLVASDASGRTYQTAIPFNTSVGLSVTSAHLVLADESGARLTPVTASSGGSTTGGPGASATIPVLSATGTANKLVTLTVTGKK
jgi:Carboxypeptidase regulatory-like domain